MPAPDPLSLWIDHDRPDGPRVVYEHNFFNGPSTNRKRRAAAIARRLWRGSWVCDWCADPLQDYRRADTRYCCEYCRKRAARLRRRNRDSLNG